MSKAGKIYRVRIPGKVVHLFGGKDRFARAFVDDVAARAWIADRQTEIAQALANTERTDQLGPVVPSVPFGEAVARWLRQCDVRPKTRKGYEELVRHLGPELGRLPVARVGRAAILEHFERRRREGTSPGNLARDLWVVKAVLKWAQERGHQVDQTAFRIKKPKGIPTITRRFDPAMMEQFMASASGRDRFALEVAALTGLRPGELRALDCSWIRWHETRIVVPHDESFSPKSWKARSIPMSDRLVAVLLDWLGKRREGLVFPPLRRGGGKGERQTGIGLRSIIRKLRARSGIHINGMHDFRHHYLSWLASLGSNVTDIQEIAGHKDLATTQRYMHSSPTFHSRVRSLMNQDQNRTSQEGGVGSKLGSA